MVPELGWRGWPRQHGPLGAAGRCAWCAYKLYLQHGDEWFLEACYERLLAWNEWRFRERDKNGDGLMELGSVRPDELPPGVTERFAADQARSKP